MYDAVGVLCAPVLDHACVSMGSRDSLDLFEVFELKELDLFVDEASDPSVAAGS